MLEFHSPLLPESARLLELLRGGESSATSGATRTSDGAPASAGTDSVASPLDPLRAPYDRVIGFEARLTASGVGGVAAGTTGVPAAVAAQPVYYGDVVLAKYDGNMTKIEFIRCAFRGAASSAAIASGSAVEVLQSRKPLVQLKGFRDIVHASFSEPGPNNEVYLSFTERITVMLVDSHGDAASSRPPAAHHPIAMSRHQSFESAAAATAVMEEYQLWLHVVHTSIFVETNPRAQAACPHVPHPNIHSNHSTGGRQFRQVGYMLRPERAKGAIYWLRCCDHCLAGIQIMELQYLKKKDTVDIKGLVEWNVSQCQLWHYWDSLHQRLFYWCSMPYFKLRVTRFFGNPDRRRCEFEQNIGRLRYPLVPGLPASIPWASANSSLAVNYHITVVPTNYECDAEDYALCRQLLLSPHLASMPSSPLSKVIVQITMLRNFTNQIELEIDLEEPIYVDSENYRVTFLFEGGMIAIWLPGVFVHYVDVHHREAVPRYLYGVNCKLGRRFASSPAVARQILPDERGGVRESSHPSELNAAATTAPGNAASQTQSRSSASTSHGDRLPQPVMVGLLPVHFGNWVFVPGSNLIFACSLTKQALWSHIRERFEVAQQLQGAQCSCTAGECQSPRGNGVTVRADENGTTNVFTAGTSSAFTLRESSMAYFGGVGGCDADEERKAAHIPVHMRYSSGCAEDGATLHNLLHVVTTHLSSTSFCFTTPESRVPLPLTHRTTSCASCVSGSDNTNVGGASLLRSELKGLLLSHCREIRPTFLTQLIVGEAYAATRQQCKSIGSLFYLCLAMGDERVMHQLVEEHQRSRIVASTLDGVHGAGASPPLTTEDGVCVTCGLLVTSPAGGSSRIVRCDTKREQNGRVQDTCYNTEPEWWVVKGIKYTTPLFGRFKALGSSSILPIQRISLTNENHGTTGTTEAELSHNRSATKSFFGSSDAAQNKPAAGFPNAHQYGGFSEMIGAKLQKVGVPAAPAQQVATIFDAAITKVVDTILEIIALQSSLAPLTVTKCYSEDFLSPPSAMSGNASPARSHHNNERDEARLKSSFAIATTQQPQRGSWGSMTVRSQFLALHNITIALHSLGVRRLPTELVERFGMLAASTLPIAAVVQGLRSHVYRPPLTLLVRAYRDLKFRAYQFGARYGQKLTERDFEAARKTSPVPLTVLPIAQQRGVRAADTTDGETLPTYGAGEGKGITQPEDERLDETHGFRCKRRQRYSTTTTSVRPFALRIDSYATFRQHALLSAVTASSNQGNASEGQKQSAETSTTTSLETAEYLLAAFECGASLQVNARQRLLPPPSSSSSAASGHEACLKDLHPKVKAFPPLRNWACPANPALAASFGLFSGGHGHLSSTAANHGRSQSQRNFTGATTEFSVSSPNYVLSATMRRERATEVLSYVLSPLCD